MKTGRRVVVQCKRCGQAMLKWQRFPIELDVTNPFPFDRVCGACLIQKEVDLHYGRLKNRQKIFGKNQSKGENGGKGNAGTGFGSTEKVRIEPATAKTRAGMGSKDVDRLRLMNPTKDPVGREKSASFGRSATG